MMSKSNAHMPSRRQALKYAAAGAAWLAAGRGWAAQAYPSRPVTVIVPYAPGGQGDVFARLLSEPLNARLKQPVVVENRPGASGALGTRLFVRGKPDGYTLLMGQTGEIVVNPYSMKEPGYDPQRELAPVVLVGDSPLVMVVPPKSPHADLKALLDAAGRQPDSVAYASSGTATPGHLAAAALAMGTGTRMLHVPYKGAGQAMTDVLAGHVDFFFSSASAAMPYVKSGQLRVLAVSSRQRMAALPDVPAIAEAAVPDFQFSLWGGLFAHAGTPADIVGELNRQVNEILAQPALRQRFEADGAAVPANSAEEFGAFVKAEADKYARLVKAAGIEPV